MPHPSQCRQRQSASLTRLRPLAVAVRAPCRFLLHTRTSSSGQRAGCSRECLQAQHNNFQQPHVTLSHLSSLPCALAHHPATSLQAVFTIDPHPFAPALRLRHILCRIATATKYDCRAQSPTTPALSPPRRDHARYRYAVPRKRRSGRSNPADPGRRTHNTSTLARKHTKRDRRRCRSRTGEPC